MAVAVAVAVAVSGGGAVAVAMAVSVAVPLAGLTKRFCNHIQKDFLINFWGQVLFCTFFFSSAPCGTAPSSPFRESIEGRNVDHQLSWTTGSGLMETLRCPAKLTKV